MLAERLARARKAAGLSLRETAQKVGVSQTAIQKFEKGELTPGSEHLFKLSKSYGVRTGYFFRPFEVELENVEYRKRKKAPVKLLNRIDGDVRNQAECWFELMSLYPEQPVQDFKLPSCLPKLIVNSSEIERVAECVRNEWELGLNPIHDLIDTVESRGLNVIITKVPSEAKFDGLAASINGSPFVVLSSAWPGDRQRFTLAHELGHLLLADRLASDLEEEAACNRFAGAFLLPKKKVLEVLGPARHSFELQELALLKQEFGLSMQCILYRALNSNVIEPSVFKKMYMDFSKRGWRKREPGNQYSAEKSILFDQLVFRALGEGYVGESKAAELLGESLSEFHIKRKLGRDYATPD